MYIYIYSNTHNPELPITATFRRSNPRVTRVIKITQRWTTHTHTSHMEGRYMTDCCMHGKCAVNILFELRTT